MPHLFWDHISPPSPFSTGARIFTQISYFHIVALWEEVLWRVFFNMEHIQIFC